MLPPQKKDSILKTTKFLQSRKKHASSPKKDSILKITSSYKVQENFLKNCGVKFACPSLVHFPSPKEKKEQNKEEKKLVPPLNLPT
jgi:hypothetical protein